VSPARALLVSGRKVDAGQPPETAPRWLRSAARASRHGFTIGNAAEMRSQEESLPCPIPDDEVG
jgi:hypothetical protein